MGRGGDRAGTRGCSIARFRYGCPGPYQLEAMIASLHAGEEPYRLGAKIALLYSRLLVLFTPSPVVEFEPRRRRRARARPGRGSRADRRRSRASTTTTCSTIGPGADLLRRLRPERDAADAYRRALALTSNEAERSFYALRLDALGVSREDRA